jgi:hypothetical protein
VQEHDALFVSQAFSQEIERRLPGTIAREGDRPTGRIAAPLWFPKILSAHHALPKVESLIFRPVVFLLSLFSTTLANSCSSVQMSLIGNRMVRNGAGQDRPVRAGTFDTNTGR